MHRGIASVGRLLVHRLHGLLEILRVHLATRMRLLDIVELLLEGRAHLNDLVDLSVDAPLLQHASVSSTQVEVLGGGLHLEGGKHRLLREALRSRGPSILA